MTSTRRVSPPAPAKLATAALVFALLWPSLATWMYFVWLAGQPSAPIVYALCKIVQFALPWVSVVVLQQRTVRLSRPGRSGLAPGAAFGLAIALLAVLAYRSGEPLVPALARMGELVRAKLASFHIETRLAFAAVALFYAAIHSLLEEYYWRWFVFGELRARVRLWLAIALSSAGFMGHHVLVLSQYLDGFGVATWVLSMGVALGGAFWAWLFQRTGSLWAPWLSHALVDAGLMAVGWTMIFAPPGR
jgi:membrane protease YdiL (CAAX protease family)